MGRVDLHERTVSVAGRTLHLLVPPDPEALLDERAFDDEEFLPYWAELWPSGLALASALAAARPARVLELGCGLGVPSLVAALGGAEVLATDWSPDAVALLSRNAARVGAQLAVERFAWGGDASVLGGWPLVVAADVLYERRNAPLLLSLLPRVVAGGGEAWIADPGRAAAPDFLAAARDAGWACDGVAHDGPPSVTVHRLRRATSSAAGGCRPRS
jgi:predicted nicotinamide N-methyase